MNVSVNEISIQLLLLGFRSEDYVIQRINIPSASENVKIPVTLVYNKSVSLDGR